MIIQRFFARKVSTLLVLENSRSVFFEEVKKIYEESYFKPNLLQWQGGEYALKKRIGIYKINRIKSGILQVDDYKIRLLDPALYNFSSEDFFEMKDRYPDKKILHFKHMRKPEMPVYWDLHLKDT